MFSGTFATAVLKGALGDLVMCQTVETQMIFLNKGCMFCAVCTCRWFSLRLACVVMWLFVSCYVKGNVEAYVSGNTENPEAPAPW